jgi:hypothetical protein
MRLGTQLVSIHINRPHVYFTLQVLESVQGFKSQYFAGRLAGLQALDRARRSASYGSYTYKVKA